MDGIRLATDISNMSTGELSAVTTLSGLVIVFSMLLLLVLVICVFGWVGSAVGKNAAGRAEKKAKKAEKKAEKKAKKAEKAADAAAAEPAAQVPVITVESDDDTEIIAVISAAVAMMYEGTGIKPVIRSVKPSASSRSAWACAGINDNVRAF